MISETTPRFVRLYNLCCILNVDDTHWEPLGSDEISIVIVIPPSAMMMMITVMMITVYAMILPCFANQESRNKPSLLYSCFKKAKILSQRAPHVKIVQGPLVWGCLVCLFTRMGWANGRSAGLFVALIALTAPCLGSKPATRATLATEWGAGTHKKETSCRIPTGRRGTLPGGVQRLRGGGLLVVGTPCERLSNPQRGRIPPHAGS